MGLSVLQIRPLEEMYKFGAFFSSYLNESDFYAKPSVLLLGQYSTGPSLQNVVSIYIRELSKSEANADEMHKLFFLPVLRGTNVCPGALLLRDS